MTFWSIYCPVFAALLSAFTVTELFHIVVGYYFHRKQERLRKEFEAKVASGEIDPMQMMFGNSAGPGGFGGPMFDMPPGLPPASGTHGADMGHGQYL